MRSVLPRQKFIGYEAYLSCIAEIDNLPPVTPQPKMGKWIDDKCSACGKDIEDLISSREWYQNENPKYCPFCGIKIEEAEE